MILQENFLTQGNWLFRHRGTLPLIVIIAGFIVYSLEIYSREYYFLFTVNHFDTYLYFSILISLIGFCIRVYTVGHTPKNTSGRNTKGQVADTLNTTGIYSVVRHPLYLGNFFMWLGPILFVGNFWLALSVCFIYWLYYERIMYAEESYLINNFGNEYLDWANKTPAFIPNFKLFVKPKMPFSWKKVLKKEKNGILAIFILFCIYDLTANLILKKSDFNYTVMFASLFLFFMYLILKIFKKKTPYLNEKNR